VSITRRRWAGPHRSFTLANEYTDRPYQTRWWLFDTPWVGVAIHRFTTPDTSGTLHDHPFGFVSLVYGGYTERRKDPYTGRVEERRVRWWNRMRRADAHYISELHRPVVWTVMLVGADARIWGFWTPTEDRRRWVWTRNDAFVGHGQHVR